MKRSSLALNRLLFVSLFLIILSVLISLLAFFSSKNSQALPTSLSCKEFNCSAEFFLREQRILEERLLKEEPDKVYKDILGKYANTSPNNQHGIVHIFGEVLYKTKGSDYITICDNSFAFGCFHGFLVNALAKEGVENIKKLDQMCIQKYGEYSLGCQHGLGHGIAEYYGSTNLDKSLEACASLSWKHQLMGCTGGVFMEYIMPTLSGDNPGSVQIKPVDPNDPYHPCIEVNDNFKAECYYNLGNYYYHGTDKNTASALNLCQDITQPFHRKTCLLGLGNSIYSNIRNISDTIQNCKLATTKENELNCRSGAAWILYTDQQTRLDAIKFCEGLNQVDFEKCKKDSKLLQLALEI